MHTLTHSLAPSFRLILTNSLALLFFDHLGQRSIDPVWLDRGTFHILLVHISEYKFQVLAVSLAVANGEDADGELEDVQFCDTGASVFQEGGGGGIHG